MVGTLNTWLEKFKGWWYTSCEVCIAVWVIMAAVIKIGYGLALIAGLYVIFMWTFAEQIPYRILGVKVLTPVVVPGEAFKMILDVEKTRNCQGFVTRGLGGACGNVDITTVPTNLGVGRTNFEVHMNVPDDVPDGGICIARIRISYACNAWQQLFPATFVLPEVPFNVRRLTPFIEGGPGYGSVPLR